MKKQKDVRILYENLSFVCFLNIACRLVLKNDLAGDDCGS